MAEISPLRRRMIDDMMIRNLSPATQQSYLYAVAKFSCHLGRVPGRLGLEEGRTYQLHLIAQQRSWSHTDQVVCALRFYGVNLGWTVPVRGRPPCVEVAVEGRLEAPVQRTVLAPVQETVRWRESR
jgi:hypothetical protein